MSSAEFYNLALDSWREIGSLSTRRSSSPMTILRRGLLVSVVYNRLSTAETWNGKYWGELDNHLQQGRYNHAAVSVKAGILVKNKKLTYYRRLRKSVFCHLFITPFVPSCHPFSSPSIQKVIYGEPLKLKILSHLTSLDY